VNAANAHEGRSPADSPPDSLGGAAEEAVKLIEALGDWAASRTAFASEHLATGSAECSLCPICQAIRVVRQARPEVIQHLGDAVASVVAAVRLAMEAMEAKEGHRAPGSARPSRFEHIDIG
jgi:hypothetical protein